MATTPPTPPTTTAPPRGLPPFVRRFLDTEAAGGIMLAVAAAAAMVLANSPLREAYEDIWHTSVSFRIGSVGITEDLHHFINDALMALFFLVVGLEIKRELVTGDLRDRRVAALPALAAIGGMVVPAALFLAVTAGSPGAGDGWGIPMATDIAFALGVVALLGRRFPAPLKLFLLSLAIVDDIGAILVIAVFYSAGIQPLALALAVAAAAASGLLRLARVHFPLVHILLGLGCWLATLESGVHATIAGVVFGLLTPARPSQPADVVRRWTTDMSDEPTPHELEQLAAAAREAVSPAERLNHILHPFTSYAVLPLFAFSSAGVPLELSALDAPGAASAALGVVLGLVVGKIVGVVAAVGLAVRFRLGVLPEGVTTGHILAAGGLAGIGFTVSLFVTDLAYDDEGLRTATRLGVLVASLLAAAVGSLLAVLAARRASAREASIAV